MRKEKILFTVNIFKMFDILYLFINIIFATKKNNNH